ncbi:cardiolipin synthase [Winogradskyella alexanderae]|uniref:Cardiolipin synthase n=1 Tax=Winogradskyella alexanderae TaxID=2877123 RepID=A0ABS7XWN6_9FLAO|nr:cardiolipin synthase [Winogradskyella alexanderae]MCA0133312.1 cardiolipin synthase [Winogradskyella alexanderae]
MEFSNVILIIYVIILIIICLRIILNTTTPSKGLAYLLLIFSLPIVGIIFYLSVGLNYRKRKLYQKKIDIDSKALPQLKEKSLYYTESLLRRHKAKLAIFYPLAQFLSNKHIISDNNDVKLLFNGEKTFPEILKSLKLAKHHIHFEYYIYENDIIGNEIAQILISKAREGVEVRFIYDDFGSKNIRSNIVKKLQKNGVEAYAFNKINFVQLANRLNYRNHRKIIVIDGVIGYVGGINISDKYINPTKTNVYWRDTHLKIQGNAVFNLQYTFLTDWNFCSKQNLGFSSDFFPIDEMKLKKGEELVQIVSSGPDTDHPNIMYSLIQSILLAKKEILITTPYLIPNNSFLNALKIAALSNVSIKIIVPKVSDSIIVGVTTTSFFEELLEVGIKIYRYNKGFVHAKTMVCDELVSHVGTANLDNRSFELNFEINAIVFNEKTAKSLKIQFEKDLKDSKEVYLNNWKKRPFFRLLIEKILHLFSSLM